MISQQAPLATRFMGNLPGGPLADQSLELDERQLVLASQQGDIAAYGALVRKYQDQLCSALRYMCGSFSDAQDAAQEAFLRAFLKLNTYNGSSSFYTWLYRIAVNITINEYRRRKTRIAATRTLPDNSSSCTDFRSPDEQLLREERVGQVRNALDRLSLEHRTILVLREMENCDYDQIAVLLDVPVGTVRSRLHRARIELRRELSLVAMDD